MPQVPRDLPGVSIAPNPGVSVPSGFGAPLAVVGEAGSTIRRIGSDALTKQRDAADTAWTVGAISKLTNEMMLLQDHAQQNAAPDGSAHAETVAGQFDVIAEAMQEDAPSDEARAAFARLALTERRRVVQKAFTFEAKRRAEFRHGQIEQGLANIEDVVSRDRERYEDYRDAGLQAITEARNTHILTAEQAIKRKKSFLSTLRERALLGWSEGGSPLAILGALQKGDLGSDAMNQVWQETPPEERAKLQKRMFEIENERQSIIDREVRRRERMLDRLTNDLQLDFYQARDFVEREELLARIARIGAVNPETFNKLTEFHTASAAFGTHTDPEVYKTLNAGLTTGQLDFRDVIANSGALRQNDADRLLGIARTSEDKRMADARQFIANSVGLVTGAMFAGPEALEVAAEAGSLVAELVDARDMALRNNEPFDPMQWSRERIGDLKRRAGERRQASLKRRLGLLVWDIPGFDINNPVQWLKDNPEALQDGDRLQKIQIVIDLMEEQGMLGGQTAPAQSEQ